MFVTSLSLLQVKNFILLGDVHKSIYFLSWKEQGAQLSLLAKDFGSLDCFSTEFLIDGSTLSLVVSDEQKNFQVSTLSHNPLQFCIVACTRAVLPVLAAKYSSVDWDKLVQFWVQNLIIELHPSGSSLGRPEGRPNIQPKPNPRLDTRTLAKSICRPWSHHVNCSCLLL